MFLKNRHINSKIKRSKVTDYAVLKDKMVEKYLYQKQLTGWGPAGQRKSEVTIL